MHVADIAAHPTLPSVDVFTSSSDREYYQSRELGSASSMRATTATGQLDSLVAVLCNGTCLHRRLTFQTHPPGGSGSDDVSHLIMACAWMAISRYVLCT